MLNLGRETEGVAGRDRTDAVADKDENTNVVAAIDDSTDTGDRLTRTHEKADMAVILATFPGEW